MIDGNERSESIDCSDCIEAYELLADAMTEPSLEFMSVLRYEEGIGWKTVTHVTKISAGKWEAAFV